jgi:hypothetical protein
MSAKLVGLYYPYSRCMNEVALKKALLVFDEVCFVDPVERLVREYLNERQFPEVSKIFDLYAQLEELGAVKKVFPFPQIRECDKLLWEAAATDEQDDEFRELLDREAKKDTWGIIKNKYSGVEGIYATTDERLAMAYAMGGMSEEQAKAQGFYGTEQDFSSQYIMKSAHEYVHPATGLSLGINHALVLCEHGDYIPFTDSALGYSALMLKYKRAVHNDENPLGKPRSTEIDQKFLSLSFGLLSNVLDEQELIRRSVSDVLEFRDETSEELSQFRERVRISSRDREPTMEPRVSREHLAQNRNGHCKGTQRDRTTSRGNL